MLTVCRFFPRLAFAAVALAVIALLLTAGQARSQEVEQLTLADDPFETTNPHATDPGHPI